MATANRVRRLVFRQGTEIAVVLAVLGVALLAAGGWVFATPEQETVTEQTDVQSVGSDVETSAVVIGNSSLYDRGQRLQNKPIYFLHASPNLTITVETSTPEGITTNLTQRLTVEQRAMRGGEEFFSTNRTLLEETTSVSAGEATTSATLNVSALRQEIDRNRDEIGSVGTYQTRLALTVDYQTDQYEGTIGGSAPLVFSAGGYWLDGSLSDRNQHSRTATRTVTRPADPATYGGLLLLGLLSLGAAGAVLTLSRTIEVDTLGTDFYHREYEEWISEGEFPTGTEKRYIKINNLEDLVDIAIDSNKRVIFDPSLDVYCVVDGDLAYYFSKDSFNIDVWLDT